VRTFAEQIDHIVISNIEIAAIALLGEKEAPALGDRASSCRTRPPCRPTPRPPTTVLSAMHARQPEQCGGARCTASPELLARWLDLAHEHSAWTSAGGAYLRLNVTPPTYSMPF
jgi:hypothetical protein